MPFQITPARSADRVARLRAIMAQFECVVTRVDRDGTWTAVDANLLCQLRERITRLSNTVTCEAIARALAQSDVDGHERDTSSAADPRAA